MYKKHIKKDPLSETFIPTPARILVIIQLCLAFSLLLWQASLPFMGDLYRVRSQMLLYQDVMGIIPSHQEATSNQLEHAERNAQHFKKLPRSLKTSILQGYEQLEKQLNYTFSQKMIRLTHIFSYETSIFELAWIFFSILISILLLKRMEGANQAIWILPLLAFFYLFENQLNEDSLKKPLNFFPTEEEIVRNYIQKPLSSKISEQRTELLHGWHLYLIKNWTNENPSDDPKLFHLQAEEGEYQFNVMRLTKKEINHDETYSPKVSFFLLSLYVAWNLFFAWFVRTCLKSSIE